MKVRSTIAPSNYEIGDRIGNFIEVSFFDDVKEIKEEEETFYEYSVYKLKAIFRDDLEDSLKKGYKDWLALAKDNDYQKVAEEVREKRNQLLAESDEHLLLDRLGLEIPDDITPLNYLSVLKKFFENLREVLMGEWARYRQDLRDITKQKGFPYDVKFPVKPDKDK